MSDNEESGVEQAFFLPKGISWTLFQRAEKCERSAEYHRRHTPKKNSTWPTYYADVGTAVQRCYELYFNQGVNLRPGGTAPAKVALCAEMVLTRDAMLQALFNETTFPDGKKRQDLFDQSRSDVQSGLHAINSAGWLDRPVRCEVKAPGKIKGWPTFGSIDFLVQNPDGSEDVWDGKATSQANADVGQVRWYALSRRSSGKNVTGAGIIYFRQGRAVPVPLDAESVAPFLERFAKVEHVWEQMRGGALSLPATSRDSHTCHWCNWSSSCPDSYTRRMPVDLGGPSEIDFDFTPERSRPGGVDSGGETR